MRRTRPDTLRLAQLAITPPFQRQGHGRRLLDAICILAQEVDALELTIESPCEGMARLRDAHDTARALAIVHSTPALAFAARLHPRPDGETAAAEIVLEGARATAAASGACPSVPNLTASVPTPIADLAPEGLAAIRQALRITSAQAHRAHEALLLAACVDTADEASLRAFRLLVKRRIFAADADLRAIESEAARKAALEEAFQDAFAQHVLTCWRLGLLPRAPSEPIRDAAVARYRQRLQHEAGGGGLLHVTSGKC
jgi:hypothetical protein